VTSIETVADGNVEIRLREMANGVELIETAAELRAGPGGIFEQNREFGISDQGRIHSAPGERERFGDVQHALLDRKTAIVAGMRNQVIGADDERALDFAAEGVDGFFADDRRRRGEVDEIAVVNNQRGKIVALTAAVEETNLLRVGRLGAPHARARGKDLEGVRAELFGLDAGALERSGGRGVNADTQVSA
jgi:hypothetical protein